MSSPLQTRPTILDIAPYVPGKSSIEGEARVIKLSSNETPFGPSAAAIEIYKQACDKLERYPDGSAHVLRDAIGKVYGLNADHIVCGAGSDELLNLLAQAYLQAGDEAIYTEHGFLVYKIAIQAAGATPVVAREVNLTTDVDEILKVVSPRTKIVFIANPNNPTGTFLTSEEVNRLRAELPDNVLLVLDGAYAEYVRRNDYEAGIEIVSNNKNVVMTRTFSKIYGLASLRIGWAFGPAAVIDVLNRIRGPFNVSGPAMFAGAAAIQDTAHRDIAVVHNEKWLGLMTEKLSELGLKVTPSVANFVLVHFDADGAHTAEAANEFLLSQRIIVRRMDAYGLPHALRITIGTRSDNEAVVEALMRFLGQGQG